MSMDKKILVVDDDIESSKIIGEVLSKEGYSAIISTNGKEAIDTGKKTFFDVVITDIRMTGINGLEVLRNFKQFSPKTRVIVMTAFASLDTAIKAMEAGAFDYISKPFRIEQILTTVKEALNQKNVETRRDIKNFDSTPDLLIGKSPSMGQIFKAIALASKTPAPVLIQGETGTGKELIARQIHKNSSRAKELFLAINCNALPETLLESELFGYKKGAFTGASQDRIGIFERAKGGTLFLDDIGGTSLNFQAKLLRALEEHEIKPVGSTCDIKIDVRVIAATNRNLDELVKKTQFREDLLYRLNVITINVPPLRERIGDILELADYFLKKSNLLYNKNIMGFSKEVMDLFTKYQWPGNVRELLHAIESAVAFATSPVILIKDIPQNIVNSISQNKLQDYTETKFITLEEMEKNYIMQVLKETGGNRLKTAELLGIDRKTLYRKALKYDIDLE